MDAERVLAFRLARSGLARRADGAGLAAALRCPASDFARDAALLALAARADGVTRERFDAAVDAGEVVLAHAPRGAIHALAPADVAVYGRALIAADEAELGAQLGAQVQRLGVPPAAALAEVTAALREVLARAGDGLDRTALHAALRERVDAALMPWCERCGSHHVAPMLWRYATVAAGARLDARRRYVPPVASADPAPPVDGADAVRRFLSVYGPATPAAFAEWAGVARAHARRLWGAVAGELMEAGGGWILAADRDALASPPPARGVRLLPPGDPYLQKPNRSLLAGDEATRKRLFRPSAGPGAVLRDGRLVGLWRAQAKSRTTTAIEVEALDGTRLRRAELQEEAVRVAALRGTPDVALALS